MVRLVCAVARARLQARTLARVLIPIRATRYNSVMSYLFMAGSASASTGEESTSVDMECGVVSQDVTQGHHSCSQSCEMAGLHLLLLFGA